MTWYAYIHSECGKPAFMADHLPRAGDHVSSKGMFRLDRKTPLSYGSLMFCGTCNQKVGERLRVESFKRVDDEADSQD